jgi:hypothetical protein
MIKPSVKASLQRSLYLDPYFLHREHSEIIVDMDILILYNSEKLKRELKEC